MGLQCTPMIPPAVNGHRVLSYEEGVEDWLLYHNVAPGKMDTELAGKNDRARGRAQASSRQRQVAGPTCWGQTLHGPFEAAFCERKSTGICAAIR